MINDFLIQQTHWSQCGNKCFKPFYHLTTMVFISSEHLIQSQSPQICIPVSSVLYQPVDSDWREERTLDPDGLWTCPGWGRTFGMLLWPGWQWVWTRSSFSWTFLLVAWQGCHRLSTLHHCCFWRFWVSVHQSEGVQIQRDNGLRDAGSYQRECGKCYRCPGYRQSSTSCLSDACVPCSCCVWSHVWMSGGHCGGGGPHPPL